MRSNLQKSTAVGAALVCAVSMVSLLNVPAANAADAVPVHIFTFNDFHGRLNASGSTENPTPFLYTIVSNVLADAGGDNSMIVSAGDNFGASEFASAIQQEDPTIQVLNDLAALKNAAGRSMFQAAAVGNHEFDSGFPALQARYATGANPDGTPGVTPAWKYLGANVTDASGAVPAPLQPYFVQTLGNGLRVGIVGAVTSAVPSLVSPGGIDGLSFGDPVAAVNRYADQLKSGDAADIVIAVFHEGADGVTSGQTLEQATASSELFKHIVEDTSPNVAAIVNGHTHQLYNWVSGSNPGRPIVQTSSYGAYVGNIELTVDRDTMTVLSAGVNNIRTVAAADVDLSVGNMETIAQHVHDALTTANALGSQVIGRVSADITTAFSGGTWTDGTFAGRPATVYGGTTARDDRANESALGRLAADAFLDTAKSSDVVGGADIGITNAGGGLRNELYHRARTGIGDGSAGLLTYADANNVEPFGNNVWTIELTGAQLKQFLEQQWQSIDDATNPNATLGTRPFLNTALSSNVTFTVDTNLPNATPCTVKTGCGWTAPASHITSVFVDGAPLEEAKTYKIITLSFLTSGGDNFWAMVGGTNAKDTGLLDRDAWVSYLMKRSGVAELGGTPTQSIAPDFARQSVVVNNLLPETAPMTATQVQAGETVTAALSRLDLTSLGSPANTTLTTYLAPAGSTAQGAQLAETAVTAPGDTEGCAAIGVPIPADGVLTSNGCAKLDVTIPADTAAGDYVLTSVAAPSGTTVSLPITVTAVEQPTPPNPPVITQANSTQVAGTSDEPGGTINVRISGGEVFCTTTVADGAWACQTPTGLTGRIEATVTNAAGLVSAPGIGEIGGLVPPNPPVISVANGTRIAGTSDEVGGTVTVRNSSGGTICTAVVGVNGEWSCDTPVNTRSGPITAIVIDPAGNPSEPRAGVLDTVAPSAPRVSPTNGSVIIGAAEAGSTVTVTDRDGAQIPGCVDVTVGTNSGWRCVPDTPIPVNTGLAATATDSAGNQSSATLFTVVTNPGGGGGGGGVLTGGSVADGLPIAAAGVLLAVATAMLLGAARRREAAARGRD